MSAKKKQQKKQTKVDFLEEDPEISSQKFVLLSLVLPQSMIQKRELYYMTEFFKKVCEKLELPEQTAAKLQDDFESFKQVNGKKLDENFAEANEDQTSITGLKIRGSYGSEKEAQLRAKALQKRDPDFNVFLAAVGKWLPISPSIDYHIENEEFLEDQLQDLMAGYKQNLKMKDELYEQTKRDKKAGIYDSQTHQSTPVSDITIDNISQSLKECDHQANKESFQAAVSSTNTVPSSPTDNGPSSSTDNAPSSSLS